ncbi:TIGR01459 family HAD-type hydrolase [Pelagibacterales bacterium]|nr:TIGR01459 family HAD-type hydrolase [Pelagibacterales bacterium]
MKIHNIADSYQLSSSYSVILCDLWGVVHNGKEIFEQSKKFLTQVKADGKKIVLISNAPRPNLVVEDQLINKLGLSKDLYDFIVTSGDITAISINDKRFGSSYYHLGPTKDKDLLENIKLDQKDKLVDADFVLCTGIDDDEIETVNDYSGVLNEMKKLELLMVCANPDKIVYRGDRKIDCAGALAFNYEKIGGLVKYFGKPYQEIYEYILNQLNEGDNNTLNKDLLAIGDSFSTDVLGANNFNIDILFIRSGIHKKEIQTLNDLEKTAKNYLSKLPQELLTSEYL